MNRNWHLNHKMPEQATQQERIAWHLEHTRNGACRPFPEGLEAKLSQEQKRLLAAAPAGHRLSAA